MQEGLVRKLYRQTGLTSYDAYRKLETHYSLSTRLLQVVSDDGNIVEEYFSRKGAKRKVSLPERGSALRLCDFA